MAKDKTYISLIHKARWLRLRREALTAHPLCARCMEEGRVRAATEVHHVRPVEEGAGAAEKERLMYDPSNLLPLCHECHVKTHTEMGRSGRKASADRAKRKLEELAKRFYGEEGA